MYRHILLLALLLMPGVSAATISGTIYDLELDEVPNAIITITTTPEQRIVAKNSSYHFNVPQGTYTLDVWAVIDGNEWESVENITVADEGQYTLDVVLEPSFAGIDTIDIEDTDIPSVTLDESQQTRSAPYYLFIIAASIIIIIAGVVLVIQLQKRKPERIAQQVAQQDDFRDAVLAAMKKHNGTITQKELRKEVPFSEAKVSLVLTQLESEGKVRRIKKGRGNVIVLQ